MTGKEDLQQLLQKLVEAIYVTTNDSLAKGALQPQYEPYFRWKLTEFEYGDTGITKKGAKGVEFLKPYWGRAVRQVSQKVSELAMYKDILAAISEDYKLGKVQYDYSLPRLTGRVALNILQAKAKTPTDCIKYVIAFLKDLNGEAQEYRAEVQLKGLILQPRSIQLDDNTRLRRPNRSDFERETPLSFAAAVGIRQLEDPTAFLHTKVYAKADTAIDLSAAMKLQHEIDREIGILRLFRVGSVQYIKCSTSTDSIIHIAGGTQTRIRPLGSDKYLITKGDVKLLKAFWANMKKIELPSSVYSGTQKEPDELSIAHDRYGDSLEGSVFEKRVSSAVMGLEALYLGEDPKERGEPRYKLSMRVGKLLSLIGYNPSEVKKKVRDAYDIRSTYVHGGTLKQRGKQEYERKHGDLEKFSRAIMDYLRASIVALLKRPNKNSLIQIIDDSFLISEKEEEVRKLLFMPYEKEVF